MKLSEYDKGIIEDKFYNRLTFSKLRSKYGTEVQYLRHIWDSSEKYRQYLIEKRNRLLNGDYKSLGEYSLDCFMSILNMSHMIDLIDKNGKVYGQGVDIKILRLQKDICEKILEDSGIMTPR